MGTLVFLLEVAAVQADEFAIRSFDSSSGRLTFNENPTATIYRVEWAPAPSGPWANFTGAAGAALDVIAAKGSGIVTCSVPMCYRVVAMVTNLPTQIVPEGMALIPAGYFAMGDSLDGNNDAPIHAVYVSAFFMDRYEVTKAKWNEVAAWAATNGYDIDVNTASGKAPNHPANFMTWYACVKWCNARSEKEGLTPCYVVGGETYKTGNSEPSCIWTANGCRLPTEAEWEKAARGGLSSKRFPWGDLITHDLANYQSSVSEVYDVSSSRGYHPLYYDGTTPYTSPVGAFAPNGFGLFDMAGNLDELCWDWYTSDYFRSSPAEDPEGPATGSLRVLRGGRWSNLSPYCCVADRACIGPTEIRNTLGFRPVRSVQ
jgi:formylglycine-generating enzyme required for sulfatase activity